MLNITFKLKQNEERPQCICTKHPILIIKVESAHLKLQNVFVCKCTFIPHNWYILPRNEGKIGKERNRKIKRARQSQRKRQL